MSKLIGVEVIVRKHNAVVIDTPYVFIANHQNSYDLFTICKAALPGVVTIGKKSLKWIPIFGLMYWLTGNIMIDRNNTGKARGTLSTTADKVRARRLSVWFFPEGTRSRGRGLLPFKTGAFRLALDTNEQVVMVCASDTQNTIKLNRWNNGKVLIDIQAPLTIDQSKSPKEWAEFCHEKMDAHIQELNAEVAQFRSTG